KFPAVKRSVPGCAAGWACLPEQRIAWAGRAPRDGHCRQRGSRGKSGDWPRYCSLLYGRKRLALPFDQRAAVRASRGIVDQVEGFTAAHQAKLAARALLNGILAGLEVGNLTPQRLVATLQISVLQLLGADFRFQAMDVLQAAGAAPQPQLEQQEEQQQGAQKQFHGGVPLQ